MVTYKVSKEVEEERAKEGGLLKVLRRKLKIHWDRLKFEEDSEMVADYINEVIKHFLKGKEEERDREQEVKRDMDRMEMKKENDKHTR